MDDEIALECRNFKVCRRQIKKILKTLREKSPWKFPAGTLSIAFVDDETTCALHEKFLQDPSKTDVITFPGDEIFSVPVLKNSEKNLRGNAEKSRGNEENSAFAGEIVVCVPQALRAAKELGNAPADEILLYVVHGWLHLAGFGDLDETSRQKMRAAEAEAISILKRENAAPITRISFPKI